jgi:hypothetical protein
MRTALPWLARRVGIVAALTLARLASAQNTSGSFLKAPVFVFQPGVVVTDFLDAPSGTSSSTDFNFRIVTAIPTAIQRTTLVGIVQWTPFAKVPIGNGRKFTTNAPSFVYGPVINLINTAPFSFDFDVLGSFSPAARAERQSYTHKLVLEGDAVLKIGSMMMSNPRSRWRQLGLYAFLANVATGLPDDASHWVLLIGLTLPLAP